MFFYEPKQFENFILRLDFLLAHPFGPNNDNSGVFVRFRDPRLPDCPVVFALALTPDDQSRLRDQYPDRAILRTVDNAGHISVVPLS